jgi:hypothetical protein
VKRVLRQDGTRLVLVIAGGLLLLGTTLRVAGYFGAIEFWLDEVLWTMRIVEGRPASLRPPGYVLISRWLFELRHTEPVIRSVSLVAGVLSLPVFLAMCRRSGLSWLASLLGLFVLAAHPAAIDLAKEFKPYALELFLHLLLLWLAFSFLSSPTTGRLVLTVAGAILAAPFSFSIVVLYPGLFLALALSAARRRHAPQVLTSVGAAAVTLGVVLAAYVVVHLSRDPNTAYWGRKYDIFYLGDGLGGLASWLMEKTWDVAAFPARLETFWAAGSVAEMFAALQVALCLIGVIAIGTLRRWNWAFLWLSPWIVTVGLNLLGRWPYGVFRTNLFLLAYALPTALAGLEGLRRWTGGRSTTPRLKTNLLVPAFCGLFVAVFWPFDLGYFAEGKGSGLAGNCHVRRALEVIHESERDEPPPERKRRLVVDIYAYDVFPYYRDYHVVTRERHLSFFQERYRRSRRYQPYKETIDRQADRGFWLLACKAAPATALREYALERCPQVDYLEDFRHGGVLLRCRGSGDRAPLSGGPDGPHEDR